MVRADDGRSTGDWKSAASGLIARGIWSRRTAIICTATSRRRARSGVSNRHLAKLALVGPVDRLWIHETARIDPYTVFDTINGPIILGPNVWVQPFTRIEGPCSIGADSQLFRANLRGSVTIGPNCRIGGEVEASIVHGYSNKYHEGFLGHAYVGRVG